VVVHIGFPDPATAEGSDEERLAVFRQVRDGLREKVFAYLQSGEPTAIALHLDVGTGQ
jgi:arsenate reductase